jgi:tryptophan synthase alpha chain
MNAVDLTFQRLRAEKAKAFIPFVTAGDPDVATTARLIHELVRRGASIVEVGFPYSDPIADGSVIQASYTRALARGLRVDDIFALVKGLGSISAPLLGMVSFSLVYHRGVTRFLDESAKAGLAGLIVPDLPVEESAEVVEAAAARELKLIQLVTPTTPPERAAQIVRQSSGFIYVVSVAGITGEREHLPPALLGQLRSLRSQTPLPLCVGFGISKPAHVLMLKNEADGVIVGSALVRRLENAAGAGTDQVIREIGELAQSLISALRS